MVMKILRGNKYYKAHFFGNFNRLEGFEVRPYICSAVREGIAYFRNVNNARDSFQSFVSSDSEHLGLIGLANSREGAVRCFIENIGLLGTHFKKKLRTEAKEIAEKYLEELKKPAEREIIKVERPKNDIEIYVSKSIIKSESRLFYWGIKPENAKWRGIGKPMTRPPAQKYQEVSPNDRKKGPEIGDIVLLNDIAKWVIILEIKEIEK